jgi:D-alanyl-lipoteichoic acid acyltransferase DltB (MBOAT superfamily)
MAFVPKYILILAATIIVDYFAGIYIEKSTGIKRKIILITSIVANVGFLAYFKYFNFFVNNLNGLASFLHWNYSLPLLNIILPIGLSFHTFQAMSYTIEVYRGKQKAERHFGIYALYVMFFPQLVAGPIERPQNLLPQLKQPHSFDYARVVGGLQLILWGMFKKVVIADNLAILIQPVFHSPGLYNGPALTIAIILFAFQLYTDFSGYSDIAVGSARLLGINLMFNFNRPYFSKSVAEFWRRWHISLMSWLKDYLYYPLLYSGRRFGKFWIYSCLVFTFFISGLWHGAGWKFVAMGLINGIYLVFSQISFKVRKGIVRFLHLNKVPAFHRFLQIIITFGLICISWVFFRAESLTSALLIISRLKTGWINLLAWSVTRDDLTHVFFFTANLDKTRMVQLAGVFLSLCLLGAVELLERRLSLNKFLAERSIIIRWGFYYLVIFAILLFGKFGVEQFIYFQF